MANSKDIEKVLLARKQLIRTAAAPSSETHNNAAEGGCGVVGLAANFPIAGSHLLPAAAQMHNRGNGKGGGIAAAGLDPMELGVSPDTLKTATLLQIAYLDPHCREAVEKQVINENYKVIKANAVPTLEDPSLVPGLEVCPPDVWRYFVRAKSDKLATFAEENDLEKLPPRQLEDEFVYQVSFDLNNRFYASLGEKQAFVLSHGRDLLVFKIVGYAEQAAAYYKLDNLHAHVWIAHQRYPTKGRVWHPGGAHPFIGLNEALVHNGDFANYHATCTYLRQRNIIPLFLTDTEVSALLFDLWDRVYQYPLEVIIEALAPTTERDFDKLNPDKQNLYRAIQQTHIQASPDGPWFFIIARSKPDDGISQLLGITDTSMLRPQVFALSETHSGQNTRQIGLIASEKQAIDATLASLHLAEPDIPAVADRYWNARGGSHTDGGAFAFTVHHNGASSAELVTSDKFGRTIEINDGRKDFISGDVECSTLPDALKQALTWVVSEAGELDSVWKQVKEGLSNWDFSTLKLFFDELILKSSESEFQCLSALKLLTRMRDWHYDTGQKRRATLLGMLDESINSLLEGIKADTGNSIRWLDWQHRNMLQTPHPDESLLVVNVAEFPAEGEPSASRFIADAADTGWKYIITYGWKGQRFCGCGMGPGSNGIRIEVYGSSGDYLGSGLDGAEIIVHGDAQDQVGQILNAGKLVVHGNVGQTFMYGAKGGEAYILGNAAGRPLINAVGSPKVVINGTCLDYLAESFMAGDPLNGGGFAILNAIGFDSDGNIRDLDEPYPGANLFSLASGGAIYIRDPHHIVDEDQLNGGHFMPMSEADWILIQPYLEENARLFNIPISRLLQVDGSPMNPLEVYRKVSAVKLSVLA